MCSTGDYADFWKEHFARATKAHKCDECDLFIPKGARHVRIICYQHGEWGVLRVHAECNAVSAFVRTKICAAQGERGFIPVGGLEGEIEALWDYVPPALAPADADELTAMGIEVAEADEGEDLPAGARQCEYSAVAAWVWDIAKAQYREAA